MKAPTNQAGNRETETKPTRIALVREFTTTARFWRSLYDDSAKSSERGLPYQTSLRRLQGYHNAALTVLKNLIDRGLPPRLESECLHLLKPYHVSDTIHTQIESLLQSWSDEAEQAGAERKPTGKKAAILARRKFVVKQWHALEKKGHSYKQRCTTLAIQCHDSGYGDIGERTIERDIKWCKNNPGKLA